MAPSHSLQARSTQADPDTFIGLIPVSWQPDSVQLLQEVHGQTWAEMVDYGFSSLTDNPHGIGSVGHAHFENGISAQIYIDAPIPELEELEGKSKEPFGAAQKLLLQNHTAIWRVHLKSGRHIGVQSAQLFTRLLTAFCEAGAGGVFIPALLQLHSPTFIQQQAEDLGQIPALVNLFINAWHSENWMRTRGLTLFGLPELETPTDKGLNAAFFRLLDVAAGMIGQQDAFPDGARLDLGTSVLSVSKGPQGPADKQAPMNGAFGVLTLTV